MEEQTNGGNQRRRKGNGVAKSPKLNMGTRRPWTEEEDELLMNLLEELVRLDWKTENGFRPGYHKKLATMIKKVNPTSDIKASPHINSKITQWKRSYGSIRTMLHLSSGVGFNTSTNVIDCDGEQWEKAVQRDPNLANMRYKPWPYYRRWVELFGDDKTTGKTAEDVYLMYTNIGDEDDGNEDDEELEEVDPSGSSQLRDDSAMDSDTQTPRAYATKSVPSLTPSVTPSRSRKRPSSAVTTDAVIDGLVDVLNRLVSSSDGRVGTLCEVMSYDSDKGKLRQDIFNKLEDMPHLFVNQKINVSRILVKNSACMEMFMGFPPDARREYVAGLLSGEFNESH